VVVTGKSTTARSTTIAKAHTWYFVTGVLSPANRLSIYVNGSRQSTAAGTGLVDTDASPMFISSNGGASAFMYGKIDDIQYYNTALTAAQILQLYKMP
jgi:Concanavalin A-like lectin/glucanases superfamily